MREISIKNRKIGDNHPVAIVFECGPTHNGLESAKRLVDLAHDSGVCFIHNTPANSQPGCLWETL